jgi:hypothetical protein
MDRFEAPGLKLELVKGKGVARKTKYISRFKTDKFPFGTRLCQTLAKGFRSGADFFLKQMIDPVVGNGPDCELFGPNSPPVPEVWDGGPADKPTHKNLPNMG